MVSTKEELEEMVITVLESPSIAIGDARVTVSIGNGESVSIEVHNVSDGEKYILSFPTRECEDQSQKLTLNTVLYFVRLALQTSIVVAENAGGLKAKLVDNVTKGE